MADNAMRVKTLAPLLRGEGRVRGVSAGDRSTEAEPPPSPYPLPHLRRGRGVPIFGYATPEFPMPRPADDAVVIASFARTPRIDGSFRPLTRCYQPPYRTPYSPLHGGAAKPAKDLRDCPTSSTSRHCARRRSHVGGITSIRFSFGKRRVPQISWESRYRLSLIACAVSRCRLRFRIDRRPRFTTALHNLRRENQKPRRQKTDVCQFDLVRVLVFPQPIHCRQDASIRVKL